MVVAALAAAVLGSGFGAVKADDTSSGKYNCNDGLDTLWTKEKKAFCCAQGVGCSASGQYNCDDGMSGGDWTLEKKDWCCKNRALGCEGGGGLASPEAWAIRCSKDCNGEDTCAQVCTGEQTQVHRCAEQDSCPISSLCPDFSQPEDCHLSEWSKWSDPIDCTGLCQRTRNITKHNRCGGAPCEGSLVDAKECSRPEGCLVVEQDCVLGLWSEWGDCGKHVTCQKDRKREVLKKAANGGWPCKGELTETAACGDQCNVAVDCEFSVWMQWSGCTAKCGGGEMTRLRTIVTRAENGGAPCRGALGEMKGCEAAPCTTATSSDCSLDEWTTWSSCIDGAQKLRRRTIRSPVVGAGQACDEPMEETAPCDEALLRQQPVKCSLGGWAHWSICSATCSGGQTTRTRMVTTPAKNGGEPCSGTLEETTACNTQRCDMAFNPCRVSKWSDWGGCTTTCGSGQETRQRAILVEAQTGGRACDFPLEEVRGCDEGTGSDDRGQCPIQNCAWADWSEWTTCSKTCDGGGQQTRLRSIATQATIGGKPCDPEEMAQTKPCGGEPCTVAVCQNGTWMEWQSWGGCSATCDGGTRARTRSIATEGDYCGMPAQGPTVQAERCATDVQCVADEDCQLTDWSSWTTCPSEAVDKCTGSRGRTRSVKVTATGTGRPCGTGEEDSILSQIESCRGLAGGAICEVPEKPDCTFGVWGDWAQCSKSCGGGQTFRVREAGAAATTTAMPGFFGRRLDATQDGSATELYNCPSSKDLVHWETWSEEQMKWCCQNKGLCFAKIDYELCEGPLNVTQPCNEDACDVNAVDCKYSDWGTWGTCSTCDGQQSRVRNIETEPQSGGLDCLLQALTETRKCPRTCGQTLYYCVWNDWTEWSGTCSTTCGAGVEQRSRGMGLKDVKPEDPLAIAAEQKDCDGEVVDLRSCERNPTCAETCVPEDCVIGDWAEWSQPTCEGLCKRERTVAKPNNECGKPCEGTLNATKVCPSDCDSKDCQISEWSDWSACSSTYDQKYRSRGITQQPLYSGKGCSAVLNETAACTTGVGSPVDCAVADWGDWSQCDKTCGGGQRIRSREIAQEATNNGRSCKDTLQVTDSCNAMACEADVKEQALSWDCQMSAWSAWSGCSGSQDPSSDTRQNYRTRFVLHSATGEGKPCQDTLKETAGCGQDEAKNCILSTWSEWSVCPVSCGGGQHSRSRNVEDRAVAGGLPCQGPLLEASPCGETSCSGDAGSTATACKVTPWDAWSSCSVTCGQGYKERRRRIAQPALAGMDGCDDVLIEVDNCEQSPCDPVVDCRWADWSQWGSCVPAPDICGVGYKRRMRKIETMPSGGGQLCAPLGSDEVTPVTNCRGQPECCINGKWWDWAEWGTCSTTCGKGVKKRERNLRTKETWCGIPAEGSALDYDSCDAGDCHIDQDCVFSDWSAYTPCSADCHGSHARTRTILKNATGNGKRCDGSLEESERCNPAPNSPDPYSCEQLGPDPKAKQDCLMQEWSEWSACTATCELGSQNRARTVQEHAWNGGKACSEEADGKTSLKQVRTCHAGVSCFTPDRVNCKWGDWTEWDKCNHLDFKSRSRAIAVPPAAGGLACEGDVRQLAHCEGKKKETCGFETFMCKWDDWSAWSDCSMTCGKGGEKKRHRKLVVSNNTVNNIVSKFSEEKAWPELEEQLHEVRTQRFKETIVFFALGCSTFALLLFALRGVRRSKAVSDYNVVPQQG